MNDATFWMVYGDGQGAPTAKHASRGIAETEAKRLARRNPGIEFFVLETISRAKKYDVELVRLDRRLEDELPF